MNHAIRGLLDNPQNNLKVLMDGKMVYSERVQDDGALSDILNVIFPDIEDFQRWVVMFYCVIMISNLKSYP